MTGLKPIRRALISVFDKTNLMDLVRCLKSYEVEILSTGGTARAIRDAGIPVIDVAEHTGFPEILDGRVKTLHPAIHGGILARRGEDAHREALRSHKIAPIDLVVINLYPFEQSVARGDDFAGTVENIDIGGPAMIRSAAKNHDDVAVLVDPADYDQFLADMAADRGSLTGQRRRDLAAKAFARTAAYDAAIAGWFAKAMGEDLPIRHAVVGRRAALLRYGENPHQAAAHYVTDPDRPGLASARQVQGKALSYNNLNDTDAAFELICDLERSRPAVAIIKHANPCGVALGDTYVEAYERALKCDPVSAFGGIVALNGPLDGPTAARIASIFTEVIIAPDADEEARTLLAEKKNLRLLLTGGLADPGRAEPQLTSIGGGYLLQTRDTARIGPDALRTVTTRAPSDQEIADLLFAFRVAKHVKSNAIVYARDGMTAGIGAGQMNRRDSARIAALRAQEAADTAGEPRSLAHGGVVASDAFFPFADGLLEAAEAGVTAVVQPGGSVRDAEVIAAADERGLAMVFTDTRHFRH